MKPDGTPDVQDILAQVDTLWPWEKEQLLDKLMTREMLQIKIGQMSAEEINDYTGLYCYEDEMKDPEDMTLDEVMKYHSKSELIEWLISKGASMNMLATLYEKGVVKREKKIGLVNTNAKFKKGDKVWILENQLDPSVVNHIGVVTKIYRDSETGEPLYRVRLAESKNNLRGVAEESCLKAVEQYKVYKNILHLTLTGKWYDEIASGRKKEEYRDITPFWKSRLEQAFDGKTTFKKYDAIRFRRGRYGKTTMLVECRSIYVGYGRPELGAPEGKEVYILDLGKIINEEA